MAEELPPAGDPRVYMAAERTFLAWLRTGIALMGFGFVVARFGLFLRELTLGSAAATPHRSSISLPVGVALIAVGIAVNLISAVRHRRYVEAIDRGTFRTAFGSTFGFALAALLGLIGLIMAVYLAIL